jgi:hypothetical protein
MIDGAKGGLNFVVGHDCGDAVDKNNHAAGYFQCTTPCTVVRQHDVPHHSAWRDTLVTRLVLPTWHECDAFVNGATQWSAAQRHVDRRDKKDYFSEIFSSQIYYLNLL